MIRKLCGLSVRLFLLTGLAMALAIWTVLLFQPRPGTHLATLITQGEPAWFMFELTLMLWVGLCALLFCAGWFQRLWDDL